MNTLLTSRKFWATIVGLIVLVVAQFLLPNFSLNVEEAAALIVIVVSYLIGVAVDPGSGGVLKSRKFWAAAVGLLFIVLNALGVKTIITPDQLLEIILLFAGYIFSVALEKPKVK